MRAGLGVVCSVQCAVCTVEKELQPGAVGVWVCKCLSVRVWSVECASVGVLERCSVAVLQCLSVGARNR